MWAGVYGVREQVVVVKRTTAWVLRGAPKGAGKVGVDRDGQVTGDATVEAEGHAR